MKTSQNKSRKFLTRGLVVIMAIALLVQPFLVFGLTSGAQESYSTEIMQVKGGKKAIATFTVDDGYYANDTAIAEIFGEYGLPASLMVVPSRIQGIAPYTSGYSNILQLTELTKSGLLEVQSHSYSHIYMTGDFAANATEENYQREIVESKEYLETNFPGTDVITFAIPGGSNYTSDAMELVAKTYYAARAASSASVSSIQSLTPSDDTNSGGWYKLKTIWLTNANVEGINTYLDTCVTNGGWFISGVHNIINAGNYDITQENLKLILDNAKGHAQAGDLWVATFSDATKYLREYQHSSVKQYMGDYGMYVEVTMDEVTDGGMPLSADIFDMPLTVKVEIPEAWANVRFSQRGVHTTVESFTEGEKTYAYLDVVPNSGAVLVSNADEELTLNTLPAGIAAFAMAKGGATGIATMTFDDGIQNTSAKVSELCEQYGLTASIMMNTNNFTDSRISFWQNLYAQGYIAPDAHSTAHANMSSSSTPELLQSEIVDQYNNFKTWFPDNDSLTFAYPYNSYCKDAREKVAEYYYAARGGTCTIIDAPSAMQSLDPAIDPINNSRGSWYNLYQTRMQQNNKAYQPGNAYVITQQDILDRINKCATDGGWFISIAHHVLPTDGHYDVTVDQLHEIMALMKELQDAGDLWVATFTDATKYIRERQNSTVAVQTYGDGVYLINVTMADTTADGLPLDITATGSDGTVRKVFNMPLTVKLEVPSGWKQVVYSQAGGEEAVADTFTELDKTYAYVDVVPNGGEVKLTYASASGDAGVSTSKPVGYYEAPEGSYVPTSDDVTYVTFAKEEDFLNNGTPIAEYTDTTLLSANLGVSGVGYVHIYKNLSSSQKIELLSQQSLVINLGGKTVSSWNGFKYTTAGNSLTMKNGCATIAGQLHGYGKGDMTFENVNITVSYGTFGHGFAVKSWTFKDCIVSLAAQNSHFFIGSNPLSANNKIVFDNTDIVVTGSISSTYGLFRIVADGTSYSYNIYLKNNSSLKGEVPFWMSINESASSVVKSAHNIFIEEGFAVSDGAKPDFTYSANVLNGQVVESAAIKAANDGKCKINVVEPRSTYSLIGDLVYEELGAGYYAITVPSGVIDAPVGYYIQPEGAWTPGDPAITYAIFASESDYLNNKAPIKTSTSSTFTVADILTSGGYVHLFGDVSLSGQITLTSAINVTFNLGGYKLSSFRIATVDKTMNLIVKNGTLNVINQINMRNNSTLLIENVVINNSHENLLYGAALKSVIYRDSIINLNANNSYFWIGSNPLISSVGEIRFENTDLFVNGSVTAEDHALFRIIAQSNKNNAFHITFDKNSSIQGNVPCLVRCQDSSATLTIITPNVISFEVGFTASSDAIPNFKYLNKVYDTENEVLSDFVLTDAGDSRCQILVVNPGETVAVTEEYSFEELDGLYVLTLKAEEEPETPIEPDEPEDPDAWSPAADTIFAVFESKEIYEKGGAPVKEYNGSITIAELTSLDSCYVVLFKEASTSGRLDLTSANSNVVLDLNKNVLNLNAGFLTRNGYLKITNGTLNFKGGQIHPRENSTVIYEGLTINATSGNQLGYGTCTKLLEYNNCTVYLNSSANYFYLAGYTTADRTVLNIVKTHFVLNNSLDKPFFDIREQVDGYSAHFDINIDGESSITGTGTMPALVGLSEYFTANGNKYSAFEATQVIRIADGFKMSTILNHGLYTFVSVDYEASVAAGAAVTSTERLIANDDRCKIYFGDTLANSATLYANPNSDNSAYSFSYSMDKVNVGWYRVNSDGVYFGTYAVKNDDGKVKFAFSDYNKFNNGETVYFVQDIIYYKNGEYATKTDVILDLGGNNMLISARFYLGYYNGGYHPINYTFKNGTIDAKLGDSFYGYGHADATLTFDNVTVNYSSRGTLFGMYTGAVVIKNKSIINAEGGCVVGYMANGKDYQGVKIIDSTVTASYITDMYMNTKTNLDYSNFYIKNSVINCASYVFKVNNASSTADNYISLDIIGSKITAPAIVYVTEQVPGDINVRLSDSYFSQEPKINLGTNVSNNGQFTVSVATGERLMEVDGVEGYTYYAGRFSMADEDFQANLTLFTNFNINFFANPDVITGVYLDGVAITPTVYNGMDKYVVSDIAPNTAAEDMQFTVWVEKDGVTYKVPLTYSVLIYAKQVIAGETSELSRQLVLSAVEYIQAAYAYCGNTVPEFDAGDVTVEKQDTSAEAVTSLTAAIDSAQLNLKESAYFRFNLKSDYTGTLKINGKAYKVEGGTVNGVSYVEVDIRAYSLTENITVEADGVTASYSLKNYRNSKKVLESVELGNLVDALYTYGYYAKEYNEFKKNNPNLD